MIFKGKAGMAGAAALMSLPFWAQSGTAADLGADIPYVADWSGIYLGAHTGVVFNNVKDRTTGTNADQTNVPLGLFGGVNFQADQMVFGLELDTNLVTFGGDNKFGALNDRYTFTPGGSARLRAGYAFGNTLAFATGGYGLGFGEVKLASGDKKSKAHHGWVFGAGFEHAINENWSLRTGYQFRDFNAKTYNVGAVSRRVDYKNAHVLRAGIRSGSSTSCLPSTPCVWW
ncbi:MAG: outer membrane protein [Hyphomicrobiales bacterium]